MRQGKENLDLISSEVHAKDVRRKTFGDFASKAVQQTHAHRPKLLAKNEI